MSQQYWRPGEWWNEKVLFDGKPVRRVELLNKLENHPDAEVRDPDNIKRVLDSAPDAGDCKPCDKKAKGKADYESPGGDEGNAKPSYESPGSSSEGGCDDKSWSEGGTRRGAAPA